MKSRNTASASRPVFCSLLLLLVTDVEIVLVFNKYFVVEFQDYNLTPYPIADDFLTADTLETRLVYAPIILIEPCIFVKMKLISYRN